jgi:predicted nuclease of predicted toxin-antitoxin system
MKILIDECLPRKLKQTLKEHEVMSVPEAGWAGKKNGELLRLMIGAFDIFLSIDSNLEYQQKLIGQPVSFVLLSAKNNRFETLLPLMSEVRHALETIQSGQVIRIVEKQDQSDAE